MYLPDHRTCLGINYRRFKVGDRVYNLSKETEMTVTHVSCPVQMKKHGHNMHIGIWHYLLDDRWYAYDQWLVRPGKAVKILYGQK